MNSNISSFTPPPSSSIKSMRGCILISSLLTLALLLILSGVGMTLYFLGQPKSTDKLEVSITTPANESEVLIHSPLTVWASASASGGVTRMELWEGGYQINGVTASNSQGVPELKASFQWLPTTLGKHALEVRAYGKSVDLNAAALVVVNVINAQPGTPRATSGDRLGSQGSQSLQASSTSTPTPTLTPVPTATETPFPTPKPRGAPPANNGPGQMPGGGGAPPGGGDRPGGQPGSGGQNNRPPGEKQ